MYSNSNQGNFNHCPHGTALYYDGVQLYYLLKRRLSFLSQFYKHTATT